MTVAIDQGKRQSKRKPWDTGTSGGARCGTLHTTKLFFIKAQLLRWFARVTLLRESRLATRSQLEKETLLSVAALDLGGGDAEVVRMWSRIAVSSSSVIFGRSSSYILNTCSRTPLGVRSRTKLLNVPRGRERSVSALMRSFSERNFASRRCWPCGLRNWPPPAAARSAESKSAAPTCPVRVEGRLPPRGGAHRSRALSRTDIVQPSGWAG